MMNAQQLLRLACLYAIIIVMLRITGGRSNSFELDYLPRYTLEENVTGLSKGFGQNFSNLHTIPYHTIFV